MTPLGFEGSDALQNLTESLLAARLLSAGVFVVMHGQVFPVSQVRKDKDKATSVKAVRNSDLRYLGHEYFSQETLKKRMDHVLWSYAQLQQRTKAGRGLFSVADFSRMVIAGYDIGSQQRRR